MSKEKKQTIETVFEGPQVLDMADRAFETAIKKMFQELKETILKELKESIYDYDTSNRKYQ